MEDHKNNERRIARLLREVVDHRELRPIGEWGIKEGGGTFLCRYCVFIWPNSIHFLSLSIPWLSYNTTHPHHLIGESIERQIAEQQLFSVEEERQRIAERRQAIRDELILKHQQEAFLKTRQEALQHATVGGSLLVVAAVIRKIIFKV